jgi:hypothetical protein
MVARMSGKVLRVAMALGSLPVAALLAGCANECSAGQTRCNGNQIESCAAGGGDGLPGGLAWNVDTTCSGANPYCVLMPSPHPPIDMANGPTCAASPAPVPECTGDGGAVCWQNIPAECEDGFIVLGGLSVGTPAGSGIPCAAPNPFCVAPVGCAASPMVVSECAAASTTCWENAPATCTGGFVQVTGDPCSDGGMCTGSLCPEGGSCCEPSDDQ